ncbi:MAG: hypothetical protein HC769_21750 [Cyanobacteria bacterium CRU_2_1]|nr:hypothetical protein [Cyanobacteria bacterium CRU_2_1]
MQIQQDKSNKVSTAHNIIAGTAGLFTGGLIGALLSPLALNLYAKLGAKGGSRWFAWAATGIIGAPVSWGMMAAIAPQSFKPVSTTPQTQVVESPAPKAAIGEFATNKFKFVNIRIEPYTGETYGSDVAGKLVAVYADVTNKTNESAAPAGINIYSIKDSQGSVFQAAAFMIGVGDEQVKSTDNILPGQKRNKVRLGIFDVSPNATGLQVGFKSGFGSAEYVQPK